MHFVGISNWKLDVSKQNRMIFVARGQMDHEDLVSTCSSIYESFLAENQELAVIKTHVGYKRFSSMINSMFEIVSRSYVEFRRRQMDWTGDRNLHGSRDYYFLVKFIIHNIEPKMLDDLDTLPQTLCDVAVKGIGRNFEGSKESYKVFMKIFKEQLTDSDLRTKAKILPA